MIYKRRILQCQMRLRVAWFQQQGFPTYFFWLNHHLSRRLTTISSPFTFFAFSTSKKKSLETIFLQWTGPSFSRKTWEKNTELGPLGTPPDSKPPGCDVMELRHETVAATTAWPSAAKSRRSAMGSVQTWAAAMGFNGNLMGFNGNLMEFNGNLMGFNGNIMDIWYKYIWYPLIMMIYHYL